MDKNSVSGMFRTRNVLGAVLMTGLVAGSFLSNFWSGFGTGGSTGVMGLGTGNSSNAKPDDVKDPATEATTNESTTSSKSPPGAMSLSVIKVLIDERSYFIRSSDAEIPAQISDVVTLAKEATGDTDGIRVRVYRKKTSRIKAEQELQDALLRAGIADSAIHWIPAAVE